jgi:hypothetical protein
MNNHKRGDLVDVVDDNGNVVKYTIFTLHSPTKIHIRSMDMRIEHTMVLNDNWKVKELKFPHTVNFVSQHLLTDKSLAIDMPLMLNMPYDTLRNFCRVNSKALKICNDDSFWKLKMEKDYPSQLENKLPFVSYKNMYIGIEQYKTIWEMLKNDASNYPEVIVDPATVMLYLIYSYRVNLTNLDQLLILYLQMNLEDESGKAKNLSSEYDTIKQFIRQNPDFWEKIPESLD